MTPSPSAPYSQALREMERERERETERKRKKDKEGESERKLQCEPRGQIETEGAMEGEDS